MYVEQNMINIANGQYNTYSFGKIFICNKQTNKQTKRNETKRNVNKANQNKEAKNNNKGTQNETKENENKKG